MRDISHKQTTLRTARARATLRVAPATIAVLREDRAPKGDPLPVARVAAIQAAKNASQLIPYCHPIALDWVGVEFEIAEASIEVEVAVKAIQKTGVEMEALAGAAAAALTIYDMLKPIDETMEIAGVRLIEKTGGKTDWRKKPPRPPRAAVVVISDSVAAGKRQDATGAAIAERLVAEGLEIAVREIVPDEPEEIVALLHRLADEEKLDLVLTTGGTGLSRRDRTPEAMQRVIEREAPGIVEAARAHGQVRTPLAMLSRGRAGLRGGTLIVNLPGSSRGAAETLDALFPALHHALRIARTSGGGHGATGE
jgi:molybdenum cofactor biosynthesis protein MoaC